MLFFRVYSHPAREIDRKNILEFNFPALSLAEEKHVVLPNLLRTRPVNLLFPLCHLTPASPLVTERPEWRLSSCRSRSARTPRAGDLALDFGLDKIAFLRFVSFMKGVLNRFRQETLSMMAFNAARAWFLTTGEKVIILEEQVIDAPFPKYEFCVWEGKDGFFRQVSLLLR